MSYDLKIDNSVITGGGEVSLNGIETLSNKIVKFQDGTNVSPSITFAADDDTGVYRIGSGNIGWSCNGVKEMDLSPTLLTSANPINLPSGTNTNTAVQIGSAGTGVYSSAANTLNLATSGTDRLILSTGTITANQPIALPNGGITSCALQFGASANTGLIYSTAPANRFSCVAGGTSVCQFASGFTNFFQTVYVPTGTAAAPAIAGNLYTNTGISFGATPNLYLNTAGVVRVDINQNGVNFSPQIQAKSGTAGDPGYSFFSYQSTGFYAGAGPVICTTVNGVQRMNVSGTSVQLNGVPLDANGNNIQNAPQMGNGAGNLELKMNSTGAGGTLTLTGGTGLISNTAGGGSGNHLVLTINGVNYKIALLNP